MNQLQHLILGKPALANRFLPHSIGDMERGEKLRPVQVSRLLCYEFKFNLSFLKPRFIGLVLL